MPDFSIQITANTVAWWGAIVGTIGFVVSTYNVWRDRSRLKIKFKMNNFVYHAEALGYPAGKPHISVSVYNTGRRPIKIEKVWFKLLGEKASYIVTDSLVGVQNKVLTEEHPSVSFLSLEEQINTHLIYRVFVEDGRGKTYRKFIKPVTLPFRWMSIRFRKIFKRFAT